MKIDTRITGQSSLGTSDLDNGSQPVNVKCVTNQIVFEIRIKLLYYLNMNCIFINLYCTYLKYK